MAHNTRNEPVINSVWQDLSQKNQAGTPQKNKHQTKGRRYAEKIQIWLVFYHNQWSEYFDYVNIGSMIQHGSKQLFYNGDSRFKGKSGQ